MAYTIVTEIFYGGAWHDISADVRNRNPVSVTRGAQDESARVQPGRMTFTLNNGTSRVNGVVGRYTPRNPSSDLYGLIGRNTPVRQSLDGIRRFQGEISEWPSRWGHDGAEVWISINAYGILRRLRQGGGSARASFRRFTETKGADAYWPLDSGRADTLPGAPTLGVAALTPQPTTFGTENTKPLHRIGEDEIEPWIGTGLQFYAQSHDEQMVSSWQAPIVMPATVHGLEMEFYIRFPTGPLPQSGTLVRADNADLRFVLTGIGSPRLDWVFRFTVQDALDVGGNSSISVYVDGVLHQSRFVFWLAPTPSQPWNHDLGDGRAHFVRVAVRDHESTANAVRLEMEVDGAAALLSGSIPSGGPAAVITGLPVDTLQGVTNLEMRYTAGDDASGTSGNVPPTIVGHPVLRRQDTSGELPSATDKAATVTAAFGDLSEPAGRRIERLCAENGIPFRGIGDLDDTEPLGHQYAAPLLELLEQAADTDGGILFEDRGPVNLLVGTDGTFEDGETVPWVGLNATVANTTEQAHSGSHSLKVTSTVATGTVTAITLLSASAVVKAGEVITGVCWVRPFAENLQDGRITLEFRDSGGTLAIADGPIEPLLWNGLWIFQTATAVAPTGSETCRIQYRGTILGGVGAGYYVDDVALTWGVEGSPPLDPSAPVGLAYATRRGLYNRPAMLELDYAGTATKGGHVSELTPVDDDQTVANDVTCQRPNGGSRQAVKVTGPLSVLPPPDGVGRYDVSASRNVPDDERLHAHAEALVNLGTIDRTRYPEVTFRPRKFPELALRAAAVDSGELITIDNPPPWLPPESIESMALGYTERYSIADWEIVWNTQPATPYEVGVLDVGRLDTDEATVGVDFEAGTDTALLVAWSGTAVADEGTTDFNIEAAGAVLHVTEITGASSPQTFTVDAAPVNGVTKTIPAGTPVHLAKPWRLAF